MRKIYYSLLAFTLMMVGAVTAKAQFTAEASSKPGSFEPTVPAVCSLSAVAEALGTDAATFAAEYEKAAEGSITVALDEGEGVLNTDYTQGGWGNFWMSADGKALGWGNEALAFYNLTSCDVENDQLIFALGQYPGYFKGVEGEKGTAKFVFTMGEKSATVDVTLNIIPLLPVPFTKELDQLNIINANQPIAVDIEVTNGMKGTVEVPLADLKDYILRLIAGNNSTTVGTAPTLEDINDVLDKMTAMVSVGAEHGTTGDLVQLSEQGWFPLHDNGNNICVVANDDDPDTKYDAFELYEPSLSEEYVYSITLDLTKRFLEDGDKKTADLYLVYGSDAVKVTINLTVLEPDELTKVGETTIQISAAIDNSYTTKQFTVDIDEVIQALGCEAADLSDIYAWQSEGIVYTGDHTEGSGGWYLGDDGYVADWGSSAAFFVSLNGENAVQNGTYNIGQMAGHFTNITEDTTVKAQLLYMYGNKYFAVNIEYTVTAPKQIDVVNLVGTEYLNYQLVPSEGDWAEDSETYTLDTEYIASKIGTEDFTIYTDHWTGAEDAGLDEAWSSMKTLGAAQVNGFWYTKNKFGDDQVSASISWDEGGGDYWCWGWAYNGDGAVKLWQRSNNTVGDTYKANLYIANDATGDYLHYIITLNFVSEVGPQAEDLKAYEEDQTVDATGEDFEFKINTDYLKETFGVENDEELEAVVVYVAASGGSYVEADGGLIDADGYLTSEPEDGEEVPFGNADLYVDFFDLGTISYSPVPDPAGEKKFESGIIRLAFVLDGKRIRYTVYVRSEEYVATGINTVSTAAKSGARYNVAGQKVNAAYKGIVIENGKKFLVK